MDLRYHTFIAALLYSCCLVFSAHAKDQDLFELAEPNFIPMNVGPQTSYVNAFAQSDSGLMWVATTKGLFHFDGYDFKEMDYLGPKGQPLIKQHIKALKAGVGNVMWAGTNGKGLLRVDEAKHQLHIYTHDKNKPNSISGNWIYDISPDGADGLWVITEVGLDYLDFATSTFHHYKTPENVSGRMHFIDSAPSKGLLLGTEDNLYQFDPVSNVARSLSLDENNYLKKSTIRYVVADESGRYWVGTYNSGAFLIQKDGTVTRLGNYNRILGIVILKHEVWMATVGQGIAVFDLASGRFKREYRSDKYRPMALGHNVLSGLFLDESGIIWVGGWGTGIWTVTPSRNFARSLLYSPSVKEPSHKTDISGIIETNDGDIWLSSESKGIDIFDPRYGFKAQIDQDNKSIFDLPNDKISSMFKSRDGVIWLHFIGTGLYRYTKKQIRQGEPQLTESVWSRETCVFEGHEGSKIEATRIDQLDHGSVFVATNMGIFRHKKPDGAECLLEHIEAESNSAARYFIQISGQETLITTYSDLHILERGKKKAQRISVSIEGNEGAIEPAVFGGFPMPSGKTFLTAARNLYQIVSYSYGKLILKEIPNNNISRWLYHEDENGNVWGDSSYILAKDKILKPLHIADGVVKDVGFTEDFLLTSDNLFVIAAQLGLYIQKTSAFEEWQYHPPMIINDILLDDTPYSKNRDLIVVEPENQGLSLLFSALDYSGSDAIKYRYFLDGYSKGWTKADSGERRATFTNLPPGEYVFRLQSTNRRGVWSDKELTLAIVVKPSWYQTWAFNVALILMAILFLYILYKWRLSYYRHKKIELEGLVRDRTADLAQSMDDLKNTQDKLVLSEKQAALGRLVSGVAHEINTPLGIARMATSTAHSNVHELFEAFGISNNQDRPVLSRYKKYIASNGLIDSSLERLSKLVDSFKQISVNEDEWKFQVFDVNELLTNMLIIHQERALSNNIHIDVEVDQSLEIYSCREIVRNIASELTNNALSHGFTHSEAGTIHISAYLENIDSKSKKNFVLKIQDNGDGIEKELQKALFDPFTAKDPSNLGLGLHVVVNLVNSILSGNISCESNTGSGSCFTVSIPIGDEALQH